MLHTPGPEAFGRGLLSPLPTALCPLSSCGRAAAVVKWSDSTGLARDSDTQAEQIRSVAIERIGERVVGLTPGQLGALDEALRLHLAL